MGDIIDRGPYSKEVLNYFINTPNAKSIRGNHEKKHIRSSEGNIKPSFSQVITKYKFSEDEYQQAIEFMKKLPILIDLPEALLIHGYFEPNVILEKQKENVLLGTLTGEKHIKKNIKSHGINFIKEISL